MSDLELLTGNERILWRGKPNFACFLLESIFNPMLPFALIWGAFDFFAMSSAMADASSGGEKNFMLFFFAFHLMPVWLYLGGVIFSGLKYKNTSYIVTDKAVYTSKGIFSKRNEMKPFTQIRDVSIHRGIFDNLTGAGDIVFTYEDDIPFRYVRNRRNSTRINMDICSVTDYEDVFTLVKTAREEAFSQNEFTNALPNNNSVTGMNDLRSILEYAKELEKQRR